MNTMKLINLIRDAGYSPRSYSGRGMYGKECVGVPVDKNTSEREFIADVIETIVDNEAWDTLRDFCDTLREMSSDGMGLGTILYWSRLKWPEGFESGEFYEALKAALNGIIDRKSALALSDRIHEAECIGYEVTNNEYSLWAQLTNRIEENQEVTE